MTHTLFVRFGASWHPAPFVRECAALADGGYRLTCDAQSVREQRREVSIMLATWRINNVEYAPSRTEWVGPFVNVYVREETVHER